MRVVNFSEARNSLKNVIDQEMCIRDSLSVGDFESPASTNFTTRAGR